MLNFQEIQTWSDLKKALDEATDDQLEQPVQVVKGHPVYEYVYALQQAVIIGTVDEVGLLYARSVTDNRRHGEHLVIYTDGNPFGEDGAVAYQYDTGADAEANPLPTKPMYAKDHDPSQDWTGPAQKLVDGQKIKLDSENTLRAVLQNRIERPLE